MPCGGIYPIKGLWIEKFIPKDSPCWVCQKPGVTHFCDEWDTGLHLECIDKFMESAEGKIVAEHGHEVTR